MEPYNINKTKNGWRVVPKEAAIINDTGTVGAGGTVTDLGGGDGEAGGAVSVGEVVPALEQSINRVCSPCLLCDGKVLALVPHLCSQVCQSSV